MRIPVSRWRVCGGVIAIASLLLAHQFVWVVFTRLTGAIRFPTIWLLPADAPLLSSTLLPSYSAETPTFSTAKDRVELLGFAPPGQEVVLLREGLEVERRLSEDGRIRFNDVAVREGDTRFQIQARVTDPSALEWWDRPASADLVVHRQQKSSTYKPVILGVLNNPGVGPDIVGLAGPGAQVWLVERGVTPTLPTSADALGIFEDHLIVGDTDKGEQVFAASTSADGRGEADETVTIRDGRGVGLPGLARRVTFRLPERDRWELQLDAVVPEGTPLQAWIRDGLVGPGMVVDALFGVCLRLPGDALGRDAETWALWNWCAGTSGILYSTADRPVFKFNGTGGLPITVTGRMPIDGVELILTGLKPLARSMLSWPGDQVTIATDGVEVAPSVPASEQEAGVMRWTTLARPGFGVGDVVLARITAPAAAVPAVAQAVATPEGQPASLLTLRTWILSIDEAVPANLRRLFVGLLTAAPLVWLLWILRRRAHAASLETRATLEAATATLLVFHVAIVGMSLLSFSTDWIPSIFGELRQASIEETIPLVDEAARRLNDVHRWLTPPTEGNANTPTVFPMTLLTEVEFLATLVGTFYPFAAIGIVLLLPPIYRAYHERITAGWSKNDPRGGRTGRAGGWLLFWPLILLLPIVLGSATWFANVISFVDPFGAIEIAMVILAIALATFWFLLYWILRSFLRIPVRPRYAVGASVAMLLLPLGPPAIDAVVGWARQFAATELRVSPFLLPEQLAGRLWLVIVAWLGAFLVLRIANLAFAAVPQDRLVLLRRPWELILFGLLMLMAIPVTAFTEGGRVAASADISDFTNLAYYIDDLLPYAILPGMLVLLRELNRKDDFALDRAVVDLGTLLFVFYLPARITSVLFLPVPAIIAFYLVTRWVFDSTLRPIAIRAPREAFEAAIAHREAIERCEQVKKQLLKKYAQAEVTLQRYERRVSQARDVVAAKAAAVGDPNVARDLFAWGPESGPWANAQAAVRLGIFLSIPFQVATVMGMVQSSEFGRFPFLEVARAIVFATSTWMLTAFVFGYFFHRIRGRNGFVKALVFATALVVPTLPLRMLQAVPLQGHAIEIVQIFAYVLILALAFDVRTIRNAGFGVRDLVTLHGWTGVTAYGSSIVLSIAGKDILEFLWNMLSRTG